MPNLTHKLQYVVTSSSGIKSISGYDAEAPNSEFSGPLQAFAAGSSNVAISGLTGLVVANLQSVFLVANQDCTIITNGAATADVQTVSMAGPPTAGTFPLIYNGQVAAGIAYNAAASAVQTALQALSSIGSGNVTCTGGPLPGTPIVCTFAGTMATGKKPLMLTGSGGLTAGTVSVAHTTPGLPSDTIELVAGIPLVWGVSAGYSACPFSTNVTTAYLSCTAATTLKYLIGTL